jgi:tRNA A37 methylthiotransferase MiaB
VQPIGQDQDTGSKNRRKPEMVFVFPHFDDLGTGHIDFFGYSLATGYIRAYLAEHDIYSEQYIQHEPGTVQQTAKEIVELGAGIVGFSCIDISLYFCVILARAIKAAKPDTTIVFGGPTVTLADELIMKKYRCVDICCRGESEETCYELLLTLRTGGDIGDVRGITYRTADKIIRTPDRMLPRKGTREQELDFLPSPYLSGMIPFKGKMFDFGIISARGCTHKCTYCTNTAITKNMIRYHSEDRVLAELNYLAKIIKSQQRVVFYDDAFTLNVARAKRICRRIIEESLNYLNFECTTRIDKFDEELMHLMARAGFRSIVFGLESASPKVLNTIKKVRSKPAVNDDYSSERRFLETMSKNIKLAKSQRFRTGVSIILGLPGETEKEANETLEFIKTLNVDYYIHNYLNHVYGTELFNTCESHGIKKEPSPILLPYGIEYSYNVFAVKPLNHSLIHNSLKERDKDAVEDVYSFFGVGRKAYPGRLKATAINIMIDALPGNEFNLYSWLSSIVEFSSNIFIVDDDWDYKTSENPAHLFIDAQIPVIAYHQMKKEVKVIKPEPDKNDMQMVTYTKRNLMVTQLRTELYSYGGVPDYNWYILPYKGNPNHSLDIRHEVKLKSIDSMEDLYEMFQRCDNDTHRLELSRDDLPAYDYEVLEKCRWSGHSCGACSLSRLIIRKDEVFTCYSGFSVGKVGADLSELKVNLEDLRKQTLDRRDCSACPVKEDCAKCLFIPSFLSEAEYCKVVREYKNITAAVEIPSLIRKLRMQKEDIIKKAGSLYITWLDKPCIENNVLQMGKEDKFPGQLLKVNGDDSYYLLYHTETSAFTNLSRTMSMIWDRLAAEGENADKKEICRRLAEERNISFEAIVNAFDMLVNKINSFLEQTYKTYSQEDYNHE